MLKEEQYYKDLWFKLCCFYHAQTELYDRSLTDLRSSYDRTEAYITAENRSLSNSYAMRVHKFVIEIARKKLFIPEHIIQSGFNKNQNHLSAQGWIDLYNQMVSNGEMNFIEEYREE